MAVYISRDDSNALTHHGVKGMKWGVRHEPEKSASGREKRAFKRQEKTRRQLASARPNSRKQKRLNDRLTSRERNYTYQVEKKHPGLTGMNEKSYKAERAIRGVTKGATVLGGPVLGTAAGLVTAGVKSGAQKVDKAKVKQIVGHALKTAAVTAISAGVLSATGSVAVAAAARSIIDSTSNFDAYIGNPDSLGGELKRYDNQRKLDELQKRYGFKYN